jgi:iron complex transport system substrate-binding protein
MPDMLTRRHSLAALAALPFAARAQSPRRIVAVGGSITETIYALGAQGDLVGVDTTSLYPAEAQKLPSVGYARSLSAEGVLSLKPTLLLAAGEAGPPAVLRQLQSAGLTLQTLDAGHRVEGLLTNTRAVGQALGRAAAGEQLAAQIERDWAEAQRTVAARRGNTAPRVLFVLAHAMNSVRISGRNTAADALIRYAGAANAFGEVDGYKPLTPEAAVAAAPDVILCTDQGLEAAGGAAGLLAAPGLGATPAGRAKRVVSLDALFMLGFGPRLPQAVTQLAERLHTRA